MFGLFKDNKPEIAELVKQAIKAEQDKLIKIENDIIKRIETDSDFDPVTYYIFHGINFQNKYLEMQGGSSREMFQTLDAISYDAEYDVHKDIATCTIEGYKIELKRVKDPSGTYISAYAEVSDRNELIRQLATELKKEQEERRNQILEDAKALFPKGLGVKGEDYAFYPADTNGYEIRFKTIEGPEKIIQISIDKLDQIKKQKKTEED